jgi:endoribonuclease Dicer
MSISYMPFQVYIIQDRSELESFSPPATIVNKFYDAYFIDFEDLKSKLQTLYEEVI